MASTDSSKYRLIHFVLGGILSGFLAGIGKYVLDLAIGGFRGIPFAPPLVGDPSILLLFFIATLVQIALWLAIFGAIAAVALGTAGVSNNPEVRKWCYGISSASHLLANCCVVFLAASALSAAA